MILLSVDNHFVADADDDGPLKFIISPIWTDIGLDGRMNIFTFIGMISFAFTTPFRRTYRVT